VVALNSALDTLSWMASGALALSSGIAGLGIRSAMRRFEGQAFTVAAPANVGLPEDFFAALHGLRRSRMRQLREGQPVVMFEIAGGNGQVRFGIWVPRTDEGLVKALLRGAYPGIEIRAVDVRPNEPRVIAVANARLAHREYLPIRTSFEAEALSTVVATLASVRGGAEVSLQLLVRPKSSAWSRRALAYAESHRVRPQRAVGRVSFGRTGRASTVALERKAASAPFDCALRVIAAAADRQTARELVRVTVASLGPFSGANHLVFGPTRFRSTSPNNMASKGFPLFGDFVLTGNELAGLWHLPREPLARVEVVRSPALAPPQGVSAGERLLGVSTWGDEEVPVRLSIADSRHHLHILGSSGTGKTTAMLNLAAQDIAAGRGVGVLDPKGDLVRGLLLRIPRRRLGDVVLISPDESDLSLGINPLELWPGDDRDLVADNALTIFKRIYERYWGPRTDDVLKSVLLTLLRRRDSTLAQIPLLLTDPAFRRRAVQDLADPLGLDGFWAGFDKLSEAQRSEASGPVLNKLRDFLVRPRLRRILCQPRSTVDLKHVVDFGQILLADLSVGRWGDTTAALIGSFLVMRIWQAILARAGTPEDQRRDFVLYVDEFQHFVGIAGSFADVLAEARSLRLSLALANQHLGQLSRDLREAVASNARSRLVFQCGQDDAAYLAREFAPLDARALMSLARFEAAARLSIAGRSSGAFTLRTPPPSEITDPAVAAEARVASLTRYSRAAEIIDRELRMTLRPIGGVEIPVSGVGREPPV
jgi:hypothetical protein